MKFFALLVLLAADGISAATAAPHDHHSGGSRADSHAPIGVMGDHRHAKGEWMFAYRHMTMDMEGNRDGTKRLSTDDVISQGYMVAPDKMSMQMHMFGAMYAISDSVTLMGMLPYMQMEMDHITGMGDRFRTESDGIGDISVTALTRLCSCDEANWHANLGVSAPTGSIDERDDTPAMNDAKLPYPMQPGSGTWNLLPGVTWQKLRHHDSFGAQVRATLRLGRNSEGYSLGDRFELMTWYGRQWHAGVSTSLRLHGQVWSDIDGADDDLNPAMVPTADPELRSGKRIDLLLGANLLGAQGMLAGHRLALEAGLPLYQSLDGPQLETDWLMMIGWQKAY